MAEYEVTTPRATARTPEEIYNIIKVQGTQSTNTGATIDDAGGVEAVKQLLEQGGNGSQFSYFLTFAPDADLKSEVKVYPGISG